MDIILLERVEKLGAIGDVVTVKDGYARNFLLPNKKALRANAANRKVFEANRAKIESDNASRRDEAQKASGSVEGKQIILIRAASQTGQLYGSVTPRDVADAMEKAGFKVDRHQVSISVAIKSIGLFTLPVVLHPEVKVNITVNVARSEDEAERQARGEDVLAEKTDAEEAKVAAEELFEDGAGPKAEAEEDVTSE